MFRSESLFDPFTTICPSRHPFIPCVTKLLCNSIIRPHPKKTQTAWHRQKCDLQLPWFSHCRIRKCLNSTSRAVSCVRNHPSGSSAQCTISDVDCIIIISRRLIASCSIEGNELRWEMRKEKVNCVFHAGKLKMIERKRLAGGKLFILYHEKPFKLKLSIPMIKNSFSVDLNSMFKFNFLSLKGFLKLFSRHFLVFPPFDDSHLSLIRMQLIMIQILRLRSIFFLKLFTFLNFRVNFPLEIQFLICLGVFSYREMLKEF